MTVTGTFKLSRQGGWEGRGRARAIDRQIRLVPNDDRRSEPAPGYIVLLDWFRVGERWEARSRGGTPRGYLRVQLHDLTWIVPIAALLFLSLDGTTVALIMSHRRSATDDGV
jgi:uncharacterized protein (DUF736 family)